MARSKSPDDLEFWQRSLVALAVEGRAAEEIAQQIQDVIITQNLAEGLRLPPSATSPASCARVVPQ